MKKLITIALLCAMLLSCLASCGSMQAGELDVNAYAEDANAANVSFKTELDADADVWDGTVDDAWYTGDKTVYEITTGAQLKKLMNLINGAASGGTVLEGITFKLMNDIDLNGAMWASGHSQKYFGGTFDGQGHAIGNYTNKVSGSGYQSFFGSVSGNACIKDLSLIESTFVNALTANKDVCASVISRANTVADSTITISNVYTSVVYTTNSGAKNLSKSGALIGVVQGDGDLVVENCENANDVTINGSGAAGIIAWVTAANNVTVKNCAVTGSLTSAGKQNGGIIGYAQTVSGKLTVEDCEVSAPIKGASGTAGIIGTTKTTTGAMVVKNCKVTSPTITGTTQTGGIVGQLAESGSAGNVTIQDCTCTSVITGTTMSGGILGYCDKKATLTISGCEFSGSFTGKRTSGGLAGTLNTTEKLVIKDCVITASVNVTLDDTKNNNGGAFIGKLHTPKTYINNCHVDVMMNATYSPNTPATGSDIVSGAAGLIGRVYNNVNVQIANCSVAGQFNFTQTDNAHGLEFYTGRFVGSIGENAKVTFLQNNAIASDLAITTTGNDIVLDGEGAIPQILPVGYQTRDNGNGTYDLRYVIAAKDGFDGLGVKADIRYVDGENAYFEKNCTVYTDTVYAYVMDEDFNLYDAQGYGYDYLYTFVVKGVPADYDFNSGNLQVILKTFGATNNAGVITTVESGIAVHGEAFSNTAAKDVELTLDNFSTTLDDKYVADGAIYIPGESYNTAVSVGVNSTAASKNECTGGYKDGTLTIPRHYYLDSGVTVAGIDLMNITYDFRVTEAGWYDMCIDMRMKGSGTDGNGSNSRELMMIIDGKGGANAYDMHFKLDSVADIKTESAGSYMTGVKIYLEEGAHTMTFKADPSYNGSYMHIRNILLAKAD